MITLTFVDDPPVLPHVLVEAAGVTAIPDGPVQFERRLLPSDTWVRLALTQLVGGAASFRDFDFAANTAMEYRLVDANVGPPLNANPYFETDVSNWSGLNGASLSRSTAQFHEGVASMLITPNGVTADPQAQSEAIVVVGGQSLFASTWLRSPGTPTVGAAIRWFSDAGGSAFISDSQSLAAITANTWTYSSVTGVAPANAIRARLVPKYSGTPAGGTTLFVDEAILASSQGGGLVLDGPESMTVEVAVDCSGSQFAHAYGAQEGSS